MKPTNRRDAKALQNLTKACRNFDLLNSNRSEVQYKLIVVTHFSDHFSITEERIADIDLGLKATENDLLRDGGAGRRTGLLIRRTERCS